MSIPGELESPPVTEVKCDSESQAEAEEVEYSSDSGAEDEVEAWEETKEHRQIHPAWALNAPNRKVSLGPAPTALLGLHLYSKE